MKPTNTWCGQTTKLLTVKTDGTVQLGLKGLNSSVNSLIISWHLQVSLPKETFYTLQYHAILLLVIDSAMEIFKTLYASVKCKVL
jgi:hypothetical protein